MSNNYNEIKLYFENKTSKLSLSLLNHDEKYQDRFINFVANNFKTTDVRTKLIEVLATMKLNEEAPFDLMKKIYNKFYLTEKKDWTSKEKTMFVNSFSEYLRLNTQKTNDELFVFTTKMYNSLTINNDDVKMDIEEEPDFGFLPEDSLALDDNQFIFDEEDIEIPTKKEIIPKKIKNLNPNKIALTCIEKGIPQNIGEITENITRNKSFPVALVAAMANIVALKEVQSQMDFIKRENYFKIFKLLDEETIKHGIKKLIDNFKLMVGNEDRMIIRFHNIWIGIIKDYKNMSLRQREIIIKVFNEETIESFDNFRKLKEKINERNRQETINKENSNNEGKFIDLDKINVRSDNLKKINEAIEFIGFKYSINDEISKFLSDPLTKIEFFKVFISKTCYLLSTTKLEIRDDQENTDKEILKPLLFAMLELPIDEYQNMFSEFLRIYYQTTGTFFPTTKKLSLNTALLGFLNEKYAKNSPETKMYTKISVKLLISKSYMRQED